MREILGEELEARDRPTVWKRLEETRVLWMKSSAELKLAVAGFPFVRRTNQNIALHATLPLMVSHLRT